MAMLSSLISKITSILHYIISFRYPLSTILNLRIGLRNLKVHLVCLRNLGDADKHAIQSLFSRIEDAIGRANLAAQDFVAVFEDMCAINCLAKEVNCLVKEVNDELKRHTNTFSDHLTLDDVVEVADSLLETTSDFWEEAKFYMKMIPNPANLRDAINEVGVQIRFLRDFLLFAKRTAVETQQLQTLLIHLRPFVFKATSMFIMDGTSLNVADEYLSGTNWVKEVESKCPRVDPQIFQSYTQTLMSISTLDQTADAIVLKDFLNSLISLLWHILRYHSDSLKPLYKCLRLSRFNLKRNINTDFKAQIGVLIRDAGILICSVYLSGVDSARLSNLLQRFDVVHAQVLPESNSLRESVMDFGDSRTMEEVSDCKVQIDTAMAGTQVVGFLDEVTLISDRLVRGSKQLRLVLISGMAGLGKTTFALEMYNFRSVMYHFQARAWCTISQVFDKKKVLIQLLNQIQASNYLEMREDELANKLRQSLKGKRYLILLDDVWTPQVWESLRPSFPDDATQSRVVLTSRLRAVIPLARLDETPHFLRLRTEMECLKIIEMKLLHHTVFGPPQENIAQSSIKLKEFAKLCKGLPLTAVIVAGLLATTEQEGWEGILNHLSSRGMSGVEQCNITLELSYKQLPHYLKPCFIYFGVFPEDEEIHVEKLIQLWMAEGFVAKRNDSLKKRIQGVAQEYLEELIQRNLVMVAGKKSIGGVKHCRIHDLLHDFCLMKGKQENLFHRLLQTHDSLSDFNESCNLVRLSIHSTAHHFMESRLFCPLAHSILHFTPTRTPKELRLCDMMFIIQIYKYLRVLDMKLTRFYAAIPNEIALLTHLTYLSVSTYVPVIPSSIGNLSNLETLIVNFWTEKRDVTFDSLSHTIWHLQNLKCLYITLVGHLEKYAGFSLPIENLENSPNLLELESICGALLYSDRCMKKSMRKFPNIHKLKCYVPYGGESSEDVNKIVVVPFFRQLESFALSTKIRLHYQFDFGLTAKNLRKVTLKGFLLSRGEIAVMGKLPKLEALKLEDIFFLGGNMEMEEGEFLKLRVLKLVYVHYIGNLKTWTTIGDETLPCLEKLVFRSCAKLKEIPCSYLDNSFTLEEIEVFNCSPALKCLVRNIEDAQKDLGNSIRVHIHP